MIPTALAAREAAAGGSKPRPAHGSDFSLLGAVQAVDLHSPTSFSWFGQRIRVTPPRQRGALARAHLVAALREILYLQFYSRGAATPLDSMGPVERSPAGAIPFAERLASANHGRGFWEEGWIASSLASGRVIIARGGLSLSVDPESVQPAAGGALAAGAAVRVRFPKELPSVSPGFYMATGAPLPAHDDVVRVYWSVSVVPRAL
jgi:hypothetical protein